MTKDLFQDVGDFHRKFGLFSHEPGAEAGLLPEDVTRFRYDFMIEELDEFELACQEGDVAKAADALADLVYVALGTAHLMRIDFGRVWDEVQRANMTKERATGADDERSHRRHHMDVVKPIGFVPPDHSWLTK